MKTRKLIEVKTYTFNGIDITVKIDFYNNQISLVENNELNQAKKWIFFNRGVEYMNGWVNILEAMKLAVKEAKKEYEHELAETSKFKEKDFELILKPIIKKKK